MLYVVLRTHKLPPKGCTTVDASCFKVRPIISSFGEPTDSISWVLNLVLVQLFKFIPAHLPNTNTFQQVLPNATMREGYSMEAFEVTSLYTNVPKEDALQAVCEFITYLK